MIKKLAKYVKGYWLSTILSPILVAAEVLCDIVLPILMSDLVDNGLKTGDIDHVIKVGTTMLILVSIALITGVLCGLVNSHAGAGFAYNLRLGLFSKLQSYSFANIDKYSTGSLITRLTTDVGNVQMAFQMIFRVMVRAPLMMISATILAINLSKDLSLIYVIAIPVLGISVFTIMGCAAPLFKKMMKKYDSLNTTVQENLIGIRAVKSFVREANEIKKFDDASTDVMEMSKKAEKIIIWNFPIMLLVMYASTLAIYWFGGRYIAFGQFTEGKLMSFATFTTQILSSMMMIGFISSMASMAKASINRIVEALDEETDINNPENPVLSVKNGDISFENVNFAYKKGSKNYVLKNINLDIKSGETIGIFGATGSAKSSLVQLIPRLYDCSTGSVKVGGIDVRDYDLTVLRDAVAFVLQKNLLFSGTVRENLLWGNENATEEEIINACKTASCHDFISSFEKGYDSYIEQGGVNLSGGQKQRICIARALLKNPKIIILDDSTSAVDTQTDAKIRASFAKYLPNTTKIIIAQRISSIENADRIIVLDEGEISAFGTHEELINTSPIYREIYDSQVEGGKA